MAEWEAKDVEWDSKRLRASPTTTSSRGLSAKTKYTGHEGTRKRGAARCQVCNADLAGLKTYYQKYSICQEHSQPKVLVIDGQEVQWCQLCRKFQATALFQEGRRSCTKALGDHNKRRRMSRLNEHAASPSQPSRTLERTASGSDGRASSSDGRAAPPSSDGQAAPPSHDPAAAPVAEAPAAPPAAPAPVRAWTAGLALPSLEELLTGVTAQPTPYEGAGWAGTGQGGFGPTAGGAHAGPHTSSFFPPTAPPEDGMQLPLAALLNTAAYPDAAFPGAAFPSTEAGLQGLPLFTYGVEGDQLLRLSLKLFNTTPDMLHRDVRSSLASILEVTSSAIEGCIRPGCVHLVVNAWMPADAHAGYDDPTAVRSFCKKLVAQNKFRRGTDHTFQAQILGSSVLVTPEKLVSFVHTDPVITAQLRSITPLAIAATDAAAEFRVTARPAAADFPALLLARHHGMFFEVEVPQGQEGGSDERAAVSIRVVAPRQRASRLGRWLGAAPQRFHPGVIEVEEQSGRLMSNALPVVVAPSAAAAGELRQLEQDPAGLPNLSAFLNDVGRVLGAIDEGLDSQDGELLGSLAATAQRLCGYATWRGWPALLQALSPALTAGSASAAEAVAGVESSFNGLSLLHVAVGSLSPSVVAAWEEWARRHELSLPLTSTFGPEQLTPVHLACMCPGTAMLKTLVRLRRADVAQVWHSQPAAKGASAAALFSEYATTKRGLAGLGLHGRAGEVLDANPHAARDCACALAIAAASFLWVLLS